MTSTELRVPCLYFHHVVDGLEHYTNYPPGKFRELARFVAANFTTVTPSQVLEAIAAGDPLPPRALLLTFDDAYRNNLDDAVPVLVEHQLRATFFAIGNYVGRASAWNPRPDLRFEHMTANDLRWLHRLGFEIGSHSLEHRELPRLSDAEQRAEIDDSKSTLQDLLGAPVACFAYPFGAWDERSASRVASAYGVGFSTVRSQDSNWHGSRAKLARAYLANDRPVADLSEVCQQPSAGPH